MAKWIPLSQGKRLLVDDETYDKFSPYKFYASKSRHLFYARNNHLGYMHNLVLGKPISTAWQIKFKNGNSLDCRRLNLMYVRKSDNTQQESKLQNDRTKTSKFLGVSHINYYVARIKFDGKVISLGTFKTEEEAAKAYNIKARQLFGENAKQNELT